MNIFHKHNFKESKDNKYIIFCECGKYIDIHSHIFEKVGGLQRDGNHKEDSGVFTKCKICGIYKSFFA
jgi:hypothetical protein